MTGDPTKSGRLHSVAAPIVAIALFLLMLPALVGRALSPAFTEDFESGGLSAWSTTPGFLAQQQVVFKGAWAGRANVSGTPGFAWAGLAPALANVYLDTHVNLLSSSASVTILRLRTSTGKGLITLRVGANGKLTRRNDVTSSVVSSVTRMSKGVWHEIQVHALVNGAASTSDVWLDGALVTDISGSTSLGTVPTGRVQLGSNTPGTMDVVYDEVIVDTAFVSDTTPPSIPQDLHTTDVAAHRIDLAWTTSVDDRAVAHYSIYRDGAEVGTVPGAETSYTDAPVSSDTTYGYEVEAYDAAGNGSGRSEPVQATTPTAVPVLTAAGDICPPSPTNCAGTAALVLASDPDVALALGDNQYSSGTLAQYLASYDLQWGQFKTRTRPAPGNHEWNTLNAQGYRDYFGPSVLSSGGGTWYSFDLDSWHVVSLDSTCASNGGCGAGSAQYTWLQSDLAADNHACTLGFWHHPRFSSGTRHGGTSSVQPFWDLLEAEGAEIILNGHEHHYERFAPQLSTGVGSLTGIRQFVAGTGGSCCYPFGLPVANSEVRITGSRGILEMTLGAGTYSWRFIAVGGAVLDSGSDSCH